MTNESPTAGPDWVCATTPVTTKIPAPMITPTPNTVRSSPDRLFLSRCSGSSVSRIESSTDFTLRVPAATASPIRRYRLVPLPGSVARAPGRRMPTLHGPGGTPAGERRRNADERQRQAEPPAGGRPAAPPAVPSAGSAAQPASAAGGAAAPGADAHARPGPRDRLRGLRRRPTAGAGDAGGRAAG